MLSTYQSIVKNHLEAMFHMKPLVSEPVVFMICEKDMVTKIAIENNYIPAYGSMLSGEYMTVQFIQCQPKC